LLRLRNSKHKDLQSVRVWRGCRMRFEVKRIVWIDFVWKKFFLHSLTWGLWIVTHGRRRLWSGTELGAIEFSSVLHAETQTNAKKYTGRSTRIFQVTNHHQNHCCDLPSYTEVVVAKTGLHQISAYRVQICRLWDKVLIANFSNRVITSGTSALQESGNWKPELLNLSYRDDAQQFSCTKRWGRGGD
jgi:hypothetical protein